MHDARPPQQTPGPTQHTSPRGWTRLWIPKDWPTYLAHLTLGTWASELSPAWASRDKVWSQQHPTLLLAGSQARLGQSCGTWGWPWDLTGMLRRRLQEGPLSLNKSNGVCLNG